MTGFGESRGLVAGRHVSAELRSVNNRHFKLTLRAPEALMRFEAEIERILRESISRGTLTLFLRVDRQSGGDVPQLNAGVLGNYYKQLREISHTVGANVPADLSSLLTLPGVLDGGEWNDAEFTQAGGEVEQLVRATSEHFHQFRQQEGAAMTADLEAQGRLVSEQVTLITGLAPQVIAEYRTKLQQRINEALQPVGVKLEANELIREVALFTDRADISEELVRLRSHLEQFRQMIAATTSQGRKLEFLCQEMFREANTIGSKANHVGVSHAAVEIKSAIERMREVVLNVE